MTKLEKQQGTVIASLKRNNALVHEQNQSLLTQMQSLTQIVSLLQERDAELRKMVNEKSARIEELLKEIHCGKSEKRPNPNRNQSARKIPGDPKSDGKKAGKKAGNGGNKFQMPEGLPEEIIHIDVFDSEKTNPETGEVFPVMGEERKELLSREVRYKKIILIRKIYAGGAEYGVLRAEWPRQVLNTSNLDATIKAQICVSHCLEHQPFNRQVENSQREGFLTTRQTFNRTFMGVAFGIKVLWERMQKAILSQNAIHADETFLKQQGTKANGKLKDCYMWFLCARAKKIAHATLAPLQSGKDCVLPDQSLIYMEFATNRRQENAEKIINGFSGKLHSDCFEGYEKMSKEELLIWQACLTHARRYFIKAPTSPLNQKIIKLMSTIIERDNQLWLYDPEERLRRRQSEIKKLTDELVELLEGAQNDLKVETCEKTTKAFNYFLKRKENFLKFLDDPELMCDNNLAERAIRPIKIGFKNRLFIGSDRGGEAAAIMYSLLLTCKNIGVDPQAWLSDVIRNLPYTSEDELDSLLPQNWTPKLNPKSTYLPAKYRG